MRQVTTIFAALLIATSVLAGERSANAFGQAPAKTDGKEAPRYLRPGADPWVIEHNGRYYWSQSNNSTREIRIWESQSLDEPGEFRAVWKAPSRGPYSRELWAPELHFLDGRFYIFFAADNGRNENHLTYVLVSESDDPYSKYTLEGPLYTGDDLEGKSHNRWAIDSTVLEYRGARYLIWSGWEDNRDIQYLYIAPLSLSPLGLTGARVKICDNADYVWERVEEREGTRGLNEGPEIVVSPKGRVFLSYSCGASWLPTYKVALLELVGDDPMKPEAWKKLPEPFFQSDEFQFGVGHGTFIQDSEGQWRYVYHAKTSREPGWARNVYWRYVDFDEDDRPRIRY